MTTKEIRELLKGRFNVVSFRNGIFTVKQSYYWGVTKSGEEYAKKVTDLIPEAKILDYGNHWHGFVGGCKTGGPQDSYYWVKFQVSA